MDKITFPIKDEKISIADIFFTGIFFVLILILASINLFHYNNGINSDIAAEGLLAKVIWTSKEWVPFSWFYSSEARLISVATWSSVFYGLTGSIVLAMGMGVLLGSFLLWASGYYLVKGLGLGRTQRMLFLVLCTILPWGTLQMELLYIRGGHYVVHIMLLFLTLGYYIRLLYDKKNNYYILVVLFVLHFLLGGQGVRGILMITGPLVAVEAIRRIYIFYIGKPSTRKENMISLLVIALLVIEYLGTKLPYTVGQPISRNIRKAPEKFISEVMPSFLNEIGFGQNNIMRSVCAFFCIACMCIVVGKIILDALRKKELKAADWAVFSLLVSPMLTVLALTFTTTGIAGRYYVIIFFCIALSITILWKSSGKIMKGAIIGLVAVTFVLNLKYTYLPNIQSDYYKEDDYHKAAEYIAEQGYDMAYATFLYANKMTMSIDGQVQIAAVNSMEAMEICKWLTSKEWYVPNVPYESKTAYIVTDAEMESFNIFLEQHKEDIELDKKIGMYNIYGSEYNFSKLTD